MRDSYHEQLDDILADLVQMCQKVAIAVRSSTTALLEADIHLAEQVIGDDAELDRMQADIEERAFNLLARQAPVAGELRTVVASLRMVSELERMGDLAAHVAKIARLRYPEIAVPTLLRPNFVRMGDVAEKMVITAGQTLNSRSIESAEELRARDEEMDDLRSSQFRVMLSDAWEYGVESAIDVALLGRYYERIADHAASMGRRIIYVVTGEFPEAGVLAPAVSLSRLAAPGQRARIWLGRRSSVLTRSASAHCAQTEPANRAQSRLATAYFFLPWFLTASIEAAAASGSR